MWQTDQRDDYLRGNPNRFGRLDYEAGLVGVLAFSFASLCRLGFRLFIQRFLLSAVIGVLLTLLQILPWAVMALVAKPLTTQMTAIGMGQDLSWSGPVVVGALVYVCVAPIELFLTAAYVNNIATYISTGKRDLGTLAESGGPATRYILASVLKAVVSGVVYMVLALPVLAIWLVDMTVGGDLTIAVWVVLTASVLVGLWFNAGLIQAPIAAALDDLNPVDAFRCSWTQSSGKRIGLILWWATTRILFGTGLCCTCGIFSVGSIALPLYMAGLTASWIRATRDLAATDEMAFYRGR
ncbi:MAG: hypothetical protein GWP91_12685 [Rhodobacterales bacterium]|nr:hypothetical protein [Rhodobacterales bacterium]